ncbi:MAG TPA: hypothetical protein VGB16_00625 [candidate division Zixibacteria bacterium]
MEEKFYYCKWFIGLAIFEFIISLGIGFMIIRDALDNLFIWHSGDRLGWIVAAISGLLLIVVGLAFLRCVAKPAIIMTQMKIAFFPLSIKANWKPYFFNLRKLELGVEQIVSARITEMPSVYPFEKPYKVVEVKFRRPSGVEDSFYIFTSKIAKKDRLIDILKQHIKFE